MVTLTFYPKRKKSYNEQLQSDLKKITFGLTKASRKDPPMPEPVDTVSSTVTNADLKLAKWSTADTVIIVANGPSAKGFKAPPDVPVIAVNSAVQWLNRWDWFFTLDLSAKNITSFKKSLKSKSRKSVIAVPDLIVRQNQTTYPNAYVMTRLVGEYPSEPQDKSSPQWGLWRHKARLGLTKQEGGISTGNSAYGALNLAYHLGFTTTALIGVDGTQDAGVDGDTPNDLSYLPLLFQSVEKDMHVINCGSLKGFAHTDFDVWYANFKDRS